MLARWTKDWLWWLDENDNEGTTKDQAASPYLEIAKHGKGNEHHITGKQWNDRCNENKSGKSQYMRETKNIKDYQRSYTDKQGSISIAYEHTFKYEVQMLYVFCDPWSIIHRHEGHVIIIDLVPVSQKEIAYQYRYHQVESEHYNCHCIGYKIETA